MIEFRDCGVHIANYGMVCPALLQYILQLVGFGKEGGESLLDKKSIYIYMRHASRAACGGTVDYISLVERGRAQMKREQQRRKGLLL